MNVMPVFLIAKFHILPLPKYFFHSLEAPGTTLQVFKVYLWNGYATYVTAKFLKTVVIRASFETLTC